MISWWGVCVCWKSLSHVRFLATPWTVARQAPLSMECSRPEYWSGLPLPSPGDLPNPGVEPGSPALQANLLLSEPPRWTIVNVGCEGWTICNNLTWWQVHVSNKWRTICQDWALKSFYINGYQMVDISLGRK